MHAAGFEGARTLADYIGGVVADTLGGSHGRTFTYLRVIFEDDCQVAHVGAQMLTDETLRYRVTVAFTETCGQEPLPGEAQARCSPRPRG